MIVGDRVHHARFRHVPFGLYVCHDGAGTLVAGLIVLAKDRGMCDEKNGFEVDQMDKAAAIVLHSLLFTVLLSS